MHGKSSIAKSERIDASLPVFIPSLLVNDAFFKSIPGKRNSTSRLLLHPNKRPAASRIHSHDGLLALDELCGALSNYLAVCSSAVTAHEHSHVQHLRRLLDGE